MTVKVLWCSLETLWCSHSLSSSNIHTAHDEESCSPAWHPHLHTSPSVSLMHGWPPVCVHVCVSVPVFGLHQLHKHESRETWRKRQLRQVKTFFMDDFLQHSQRGRRTMKSCEEGKEAMKGWAFPGMKRGRRREERRGDKRVKVSLGRNQEEEQELKCVGSRFGKGSWKVREDDGDRNPLIQRFYLISCEATFLNFTYKLWR